MENTPESNVERVDDVTFKIHFDTKATQRYSIIVIVKRIGQFVKRIGQPVKRIGQPVKRIGRLDIIER